MNKIKRKPCAYLIQRNPMAFFVKSQFEHWGNDDGDDDDGDDNDEHEWITYNKKIYLNENRIRIPWQTHV